MKFASFALAICFLISVPNGKQKVNPFDQLPDFFAPLSWKLNKKDIKDFYPTARVQEFEETGNHSSLMMIYEITWKDLGDIFLAVRFDKTKAISMILIETVEVRPACNLYAGNPIPEWCRTQYNEDLLKMLNLVKTKISKDYGKPIGPIRPIDAIDEKEQEYRWDMKSYNLILGITKGEQNDWALKLSAIKK